MTFRVGQMGFEASSGRNVDGMVFVAHDNHQSEVVATHAKAISYILRHSERVVVFDVIHHNHRRFDAKLVVELQHSLVDATDGRFSKHVVGIRDVLRAVGEVGQFDVVGVPIGDLLFRRALRSSLQCNLFATIAEKRADEAENEQPSPQISENFIAFRLRLLAKINKTFPLVQKLLLQRFVARRVGSFQASRTRISVKIEHFFLAFIFIVESANLLVVF